MVGLFWRNIVFLFELCAFKLFSIGKHGFVYPEVTWHKYSILIRSEFFASPPVDRADLSQPSLELGLLSRQNGILGEEKKFSGQNGDHEVLILT